MEKKRMDQAVIRSLRDVELYGCFSERNWAELDMQSRMALAQEVERREAEAVGRPCVQIELIPEESIQPGLMGWQDSENHLICLSPFFFDDSRVEGYSPFQLLDTVLHEGRHAFQRFVIETAITSGELSVPEDTFYRWALENAMYTDSDMIYFTQSIEIDARFYAFNRLREIGIMLAREELLDNSFAIGIQQTFEYELSIIDSTECGIDPEALEARENEIRKFADYPGFSYIYTHLYFDNPNIDPLELLNIAFFVNQLELVTSIEELEALEQSKLCTIPLSENSRKLVDMHLRQREKELCGEIEKIINMETKLF